MPRLPFPEANPFVYGTSSTALSFGPRLTLICAEPTLRFLVAYFTAKRPPPPSPLPPLPLARCSADYYFDSYAHFGIHEEMLKDEVRSDRDVPLTHKQ